MRVYVCMYIYNMCMHIYEYVRKCAHVKTNHDLEREWRGIYGRIWKNKEDGGNLAIKL